MERQSSAIDARNWLGSQGFAPSEIDNIETALDKSDLTPQQWLATLRGIEREELVAIAKQMPAAHSEAPLPEPMVECEAPAVVETPPIGPPAGMHEYELGAASLQTGLSRQVSARTEEFINHRKVEAQRADLRGKVHREKLDQYGEGPVVNGQSARFKTGMSDTIGHRRTMEDCMTLAGCFRGNPDEDLFAVFDGHGGQAVAEYTAMNIARVLQEVAEANSGAQATEILALAFRRLNGYVADNLGEEAMESGATAAVVWIQQDAVYVANVGDSRAVLGRDGVAERLSFDHKPGDPGEQTRIEGLGGTVVYLRGIARLDGNLAVSRSFGDLAFAPRLSVEPFTSSVALQSTDAVLIIACDGLWDVVTDQEAVDFVIRVCSRGADVDLAAQQLRDEALTRRSSDNISVMVSLLRPLPQHPTEVLAFFSTTQDGKLGIIFGDSWPCIKRINDDSLAAEQPQLQEGMQLLSIGGTSVAEMTFKDAVPLVKVRPLELVFRKLV
jgi:protein phosphatase PTC1